MGKKSKRGRMSQNAMLREAEKILESKDTMIRDINKFAWKVRSRSRPDKWHTVKMSGSGIECSCEYCQLRKKSRCAHGLAIEMLILQKTFQMRPGDKKVVVDDKIQVQCPNGHTQNIVFNGYRNRKNREPAHLCKCNTCNCSFTWDPGFVGKHYPPDVVLLALWLFYTGTSPSTARTIIKNNMHTIVDETTIERWAKSYTALVELYTHDLPIRTGGIWSVDEKLLLLVKKLETREKKMYLVSMIDQYMRFLLAFRISAEKDNYNTNELFEAAVERAGCTPEIIKSDMLPAFANSCKTVFHSRHGSKTLHWCDCHMRGEYKETNGQERANSTFDSLIRSKRSLKFLGSVIIRSAMLYYNFLRPHRGINNKTPVEMANITILGKNLLKTLIQNAVLYLFDRQKAIN